jgi:hypothetical protein
MVRSRVVPRGGVKYINQNRSLRQVGPRKQPTEIAGVPQGHSPTFRRETLTEIELQAQAIGWNEANRRMKAMGLIEKPVWRVYFIQASTGHIKIGTAIDPAERLATLQVAHALPLRLLGSIEGGRATEKALHALYAAYRVSGEWFEPAPELMARIGGISRR